MNKKYIYYRDILRDKPKPLLFLDRDLLDHNIEELIARNPHKKMRLASKSIRSVPVLEYILQYSDHFEGIMSFTGEEALFLLHQGLDDILLGYPIINRSYIDDLCEQIKRGKSVTFMVDLPEHLDLINRIASANGVVANICVDVDMSSRFPFLYFGVYRSSIKHLRKLKELSDYIKKCPAVNLHGIMGYESQIAGLGDNAKGKTLKNKFIQILKNQSIKEVRKKRKQAIDFLRNEGFDMRLVNAGGTGSLESSAAEEWVTEITVGSGFYSSHLFDEYKTFRHQPAIAYMVDIVRQPSADIYTAAGGGYTASGALDKNKLPQAYLPKGVKFFKNEGIGEVQTPFKYSGEVPIIIGDPLILRHSKSGEVCERFNEMYVVSEGEVVDKYVTYRGEGKAFL